MSPIIPFALVGLVVLFALFMGYWERRQQKRIPLHKLTTALAQKEWLIRREAVKEIRSRHDATELLLSVLQQEHDWRVLYEAAKGMCQYDQHKGWTVRKEGQMVIPQLIKIFSMVLENDTNVTVRLEAISLLRDIPDIQTISPLLMVLGDSNRDISHFAATAIEPKLALIHTVIFGEPLPKAFPHESTLHNPEVIHLTAPMRKLKNIVVQTDTYSFHQVERFLTYAVNSLGQTILKKQVIVSAYGNSQQLHLNLLNNFKQLCKHVHMSNEIEKR